MGGMNKKCPTAIKGTMNHAKTSCSTEIFAGEIISVVQYLAPLRYLFVVYVQVPRKHCNRSQDACMQAPKPSTEPLGELLSRCIPGRIGTNTQPVERPSSMMQ
jgi:hypothetical protein